ncbi:hypothetical protein C0Q44_03065 [Paenibacillus sp. PCH8]|uniref:hypothetical protein n=1 Tax=Paenibacillus sp. PCH8 TaxID=2066524 RepID=UPI000CF8ACC2|nr:hypothetical protein [Paenibacillus sp. PCH8]PQP83684.1 hypothetical protein C0Q44_03065 [Paenibacillus sp. PCH8]
MIPTSLSDILPQCQHEPGKTGYRYYASEPGNSGTISSLMLIDQGEGEYTFDLWSEAQSIPYWKDRMKSVLDTLTCSSIYAITPASFPWEKLGYRVDVLAHRYRFFGTLKDIPIPSIPDEAARWIPAEGQVDSLARILQASDPACPGWEAARQAVGDIYEGIYGMLLNGSGLVELEGRHIGGCLLSDEFGSVLLAHIFTIPAAKRQGWARWLVAYGLHRYSTNPNQQIKASLDADNRGSYRLMTTLNLQQVHERVNVCRITKESEPS